MYLFNTRCLLIKSLLHKVENKIYLNFFLKGTSESLGVVCDIPVKRQTRKKSAAQTTTVTLTDPFKIFSFFFLSSPFGGV